MSRYRITAARGAIALLALMAIGCSESGDDPWSRAYPPPPTGDAIPVAKEVERRLALEAPASAQPMHPSVELRFDDSGRVGGVPGAEPAASEMPGSYDNGGAGGGYDNGGMNTSSNDSGYP